MSVKMFLENGYFLPLYNTSKIFVKLQKNGCIFFFHFSYKYNSVIKQIVITSGSEYFLCFFSVSILFSTFPVLLGYFLFKFESSSGYQSYFHLISVSVHDKFSFFFSHPNASVTSVRSGRTLAIMAIILLILLRRRCIQITQ